MAKINPTRMELIRLKKRVKIAQQGHKLLKEKRDGLMKEFMAIIRQAQTLRQEVEQKLGQAFKSFIFASADMRPEVTEEALIMPSKKITLEVETKNVMSVNIPQFKFKSEGDHVCYSLASTSSEIDFALESFSASLDNIVNLAEVEHSARLLAQEIEKTRRRVNALEYVFIPQMQSTIKYITNKLDEQERSALTSLMRVKEKIS